MQLAKRNLLTFRWQRPTALGMGTVTPGWMLALVVAALAAAPWIRQVTWRFSLHTLLIATTLVAVVLGLIVWMSRTG